MILSVDAKTRIVDWSKLNRRLPLIGSHIIALAVGGWIVSIRAQEASLPYLQRAALQQEATKAIAGPNPIAAIKCERHKSAVAEAVADQAVAISNFTAVSEKLLETIPDCPKQTR